jgi:hypothetical protein
MTIDTQINAVINPETSVGSVDDGNNLIVYNHLTQMKMFGIRQGIELYPDQDDDRGTRKAFIEQVWEFNEMDLYQDRIWDLTLCSGQVLVYYRPNKDGLYTLSIFPRDDFRVEYNEDNRIELAMLRYWYYESNGVSNTRNKRWIRLILTKDRIYQENYGVGVMPSWDLSFAGIGRKEMENSLGFVPCRVIRNKPMGPSRNGVGEFEHLRASLEEHGDDTSAIKENLQFFGSPILMATRSPKELIELASNQSINLSRAHTATMEAGWAAPELGMGSTGKSTPRHLKMGNNLRLKKVVGNVGNDERFGFISPPPIAPEQRRYVTETRESLHFALGSIDETGIHANATAYEMKVVYGKVATTALKKATAIYTYGLCKVFEDLIAAEETLFKKTFAAALGVDPEAVDERSVQQYLETTEGNLPEGVYGLPPMGKKKISWRWTGPVFEDSPDDMQRRSIVARNMQELGVRSLDALTVVFPDKTQREKEGMLAGGYPFRYLNAVAGTTGQMLGLYQQMMALPSQSNPDVPLIASIPLEPMLVKSAETLYKELNYAKPIDSSPPGESPYTTGSNAYDQWLRTVGKQQYGLASAAGIPVTYPAELTGDTSQPTNPLGYGGTAANPGYLGQPTATTGSSFATTYTGGSTTGLQQSVSEYVPGGAGSTGGFIPIPPEYVVGLPQPGSVLSSGADRLPKSPTGAELFARYQESQPEPAKRKSSKRKSTTKSTKSKPKSK